MGSFVETWMDLETIMQSEVSLKEEKKYWILTYMWNLEKWYEWSYLQNRYTEISEQMYGHKGGKNKVVWIGRLGFTYLHYLHHV